MVTVGQYIREKRKEMGFTAKELARRAGVSDGHIIYIEKGQRRPTFEKLMGILDALGVNMGDFLEKTGYADSNVEPFGMKRLERVPVVTWVIAGRWKEVCDAFEPGDADEWIESDVKGKNVFALRVIGDSMEPEFAEGEIIVVNPGVEAAPGDFVVVKSDEEATFKQLKKFGPRWVLHPLNPRYPDLEVKRGGFRIIGKVVKKEKRY